MSRNIVIELDPDTSRFLNQEKSRLYTQYNIKVTPKDIILTLLRQHKLRVLSEADETEAMLWYYDIMKAQDEYTNAPGTAETTEHRTTRANGEKGP